MLTIHPASVRTTPTNDMSLAANSGDPAGFASLLRQSRSVAPPPAASPAPAPAPQAAAQPREAAQAKAPEHDDRASDDDTAAPTPEADSGGRTRAQQRTRLRAADGRGDVNRATPPASAHAAPPSTRAEAADDSAATATPAAEPAPTAPLDPAVMHWLADQQRAPAAARTASASATGTADATRDDAPPDAPADTIGRARPTGAAVERDDSQTNARPRAADLAATTPFAAALAEQRAADKPLPAQGSAVRGLGETPGTGALAPTPERTPAAAPAVAIAAPVPTPDFAQELGLRLSVLARDGIHEAELHLNPADMGPVSVQIVMDGTQARIDFGADVAATRQAIEAGLPELASALRDAGFTLAGGGVSQHAGGRRDGGDAGTPGRPDGRREVAAPELQRVATAARRLVRAGGVDTFA